MNKFDATFENRFARILVRYAQAVAQAMKRSGAVVLLKGVNLPLGLLLLAGLFSAGCMQVQATPENIRVTIDADGKQRALQVPPGATTQSALQQAGITLHSLDRVDPPSYAVLS
ncbi:MAG: DUF348 domain-containing protein, partial [Chloroflexi bacterium]